MYISNDEPMELLFYYRKFNKFRYEIYNETEFEEKDFPEEKKEKFKELSIECTILTFGLSNSLHMDSMVEGPDGFKEMNVKYYNENKLLRIIKRWSAKDDEDKSIDLTIENIRNLAPEIASRILKEYDDLYYNEEQEKN